MHFITVREAAATLGVSERRVQQYIQQGRLLAQKVGNLYLIDRLELELFERRPPGKPRKDKS